MHKINNRTKTDLKEQKPISISTLCFVNTSPLLLQSNAINSIQSTHTHKKMFFFVCYKISFNRILFYFKIRICKYFKCLLHTLKRRIYVLFNFIEVYITFDSVSIVLFSFPTFSINYKKNLILVIFQFFLRLM